jgi:hypothetical protein
MDDKKGRCWTHARDYVDYCKQTNSKLSKEELYRRMGTSGGWIKEHMQDLYKWFLIEKDLQLAAIAMKETENLKNQMIIALCSLFLEGGNTSLEIVAERAGAKIKKMYYQHKELRNHLLETRRKLYQGETDPQQLFIQLGM